MNPVAARTEDAYAFEVGYYSRREWGRIAGWLQEQGYSDWQVETILRSKHMRWAADHANKSRSVTLANFQEYHAATFKSGSSTAGYIAAMLVETAIEKALEAVEEVTKTAQDQGLWPHIDGSLIAVRARLVKALGAMRRLN